MKITRILAERITKDLLRDKQKECEELNLKSTTALKQYYIDKLPKELKDIWQHKELSTWLKTISYVTINKNGFTNSFYFKEDVPINSQDGSYILISKLPLNLQTIVGNFMEKRGKLNVLTSKLQDTIFNLDNTTALKEQFSEAYDIYIKLPNIKEIVKKVVDNQKLKELKEQLI